MKIAPSDTFGTGTDCHKLADTEQQYRSADFPVHRCAANAATSQLTQNSDGAARQRIACSPVAMSGHE